MYHFIKKNCLSRRFSMLKRKYSPLSLSYVKKSAAMPTPCIASEKYSTSVTDVLHITITYKNKNYESVVCVLFLSAFLIFRMRLSMPSALRGMRSS